MTWTREACAKVNWTLEILGKRPDGFHELRSWFLPLALADSLGAESSASTTLVVQGTDLPADENNLVLRADAAWRNAGGEAPSLAWHLQKNIPVAAGLGGGSSDAAAALLLLQDAANLALPTEVLVSVAACLGSDVPFFLSAEGAELRGGRGEQCLATAPLLGQALVLAWPDFPVSTAQVFSVWRGEKETSALVDLEFPVIPGPNDLVSAAQTAFPALVGFAETLRIFGPFLQSGSGGAHFLPCATAKEAEDCSIQMQAAGLQVVVTQTREARQPC